MALIAGLAIGGAATAGAASLITGRQIKDGSIAARDLTAGLNARIARAGTPGPAGAQGPAGPLTTTLPAGQTLRGAFNLDTSVGAGAVIFGGAITFGLTLRAAPTPVIRPAGAAPTAQCPGTLRDPQAAPGVLCIYLQSESNLAVLPGFTSGLSVQSYPNVLNENASSAFGAELFIRSLVAGRMFVDGTWAVTGN